MLTQVLWWLTNALMGILVIRALSAKIFARHLVFFIYLSHVLALELLRFYLYVFKPGIYRTVYWYTEFLSVAIGYCVIWEIYERALAEYPGTLRLARSLVLTIFLSVLAKGLINSLSGPVWGAAETVRELERNLRAVQVVLLVVVVAVLRYYIIPIGQNLRGIIFGYGFFLGTGVIINTLWSQMGESFLLRLQYAQSMAWLITLLIWSATLWSYCPNPIPEGEIEIERDYEWISTRTAQALSRARAQVLRGVRG